MSAIPDEAVTAAAEAMLTFWSPLPDPTGIAWTSLPETDKEQLRIEARAALVAAAPHLQAPAWAEGAKAGRSDQSAQQIWAVTGGTRPTDTPNPYDDVETK